LSDLIDGSLSIGCRIAVSVIILLAVWVIAFIVSVVCVYKKRRIEILELNGGHHVYVQYGDIFSAEEVLNSQKRHNVVIPVNRCFDTVVDDDLVSSATLHGMAMKKLYDDNIFNAESLDIAIKKNLQLQNTSSKKLSEKNKRKGNLDRYPVGTVAEIKISEKTSYFLLGLTKFDRDLKASTSNEEYVLALTKLFEFCNTRAQQYPVVMPLIGGGLSRTKKSEKDILDYIIGFVKLNKELINFDLHIIIRENGKDSIPITDL